MTRTTVAAAAVLRIEGLTKRYAGGEPVLEALDLRLGAGEYLAVMGESGAGKSTLLNLIAGLDQPDAGHVWFEGTDLTVLSDDERTRLRRMHMGFVFQAFHVLPYLSVLGNVTLPLDLLHVARAEREH